MGHIGPDVELNNPAYIHATALLYGKVRIEAGVSVFPYVVMRAEMHEIMIGANTNIQDHVIIHIGNETPTIVGENCSITHRVTLHGCEIGDNALIGINATVMDGAKVGANSIVAGHAIVEQGVHFPENAIIAGVPAKQIGERDNSKTTEFNAAFYSVIAGNYKEGIERLSEADIKNLLQQR